ncbi:hypothetical protein LTR85_003839 [Meristemomyces frigidus]|nr:hypothetical protein LTR85_003839 [Meristemomyces frigidus]
MFAATTQLGKGLRAHSRQLSTTARLSQPTIKLEVERKFVPPTYLASSLGCEHDDNISPLLTRSQNPSKIIRDTYFDLDGRLSKNGVWLRRREELTVPSDTSAALFPYPQDAIWQAKVRLGGDFVDSQFEEAEGESAAEAILSQHIPGTKLPDLLPTADLNTFRRTWDVRDHESLTWPACTYEMRVVLDIVSEKAESVRQTGVFWHQIGEVEVTADVEKGVSKIYKQTNLESMRRVQREFMLRHGKLFPEEPAPAGKLSAYFKWKETAAALRKHASSDA